MARLGSIAIVNSNATAESTRHVNNSSCCPKPQRLDWFFFDTLFWEELDSTHHYQAFIMFQHRGQFSNSTTKGRFA
jgi:hypothetical protein